MEEPPNLLAPGDWGRPRPFCLSVKASPRLPQSCLAREQRWKTDSGIFKTYPLYCHWHWIFPPHGLALGGGGFSGSLRDKTTPSPLVTKPFSDQVLLWEGKSSCCLCSTTFLEVSHMIWADLGVESEERGP